MTQKITVSEARAKLPSLLKEVAEQREQYVITSRNKPMGVLIGAEEYQHWQKVHHKVARYEMDEKIDEALALIERTYEEVMGPRDPGFVQFWGAFRHLAQQLWQLAELLSQGHAAIAMDLLNAANIYGMGKASMRPEQLKPLAVIVERLRADELSVEDASETYQVFLEYNIEANPLRVNGVGLTGEMYKPIGDRAE